MALLFVGRQGGASLAAVSSYTVSLNALLDSGLPVAPAPRKDDIVVIVYGWASGADAAVGLPVGNNSGTYQSLVADTYSNDARDANGRMAYQIMGATPDTSVDVPSLSSTTNGSACMIFVIRFSDPTTPWDGVTPVVTSGTNGNSADPGAVTPNTAGAWVIAGYIGTGDATPQNWVAPGNMTGGFVAQNSTATNFSSKAGMGLYTGWVSGAFNPDAVSGGETSGSDAWIGFTAVLKPVAITSKSDAETAAGTEAVSGIALAHADTGAGADDGVVDPGATAKDDADTGSGADEVLLIALSHTESGSGSEVESGIALSHADTGDGLDQVVLIELSTDEEGSGDDEESLDPGATPVSDGDTGSGADAALLLELSAADAGSGADAASSVALSGGDTGVGAEAQGQIALSHAETGVGTDQEGSVGLSGGETGAGQDAQAGIALSSGETGSGEDEELLVVSKNDAEVGVGVENGLIEAELTSSDTGMGVDAVLGILLTGGDTGSGTDATAGISLGDSETGSGVDAVYVILASVTDGELLTVLELESVDRGITLMGVELAVSRVLPGWRVVTIARGKEVRRILDEHGVRVVSPGWRMTRAEFTETID